MANADQAWEDLRRRKKAAELAALEVHCKQQGCSGLGASGTQIAALSLHMPDKDVTRTDGG